VFTVCNAKKMDDRLHTLGIWDQDLAHRYQSSLKQDLSRGHLSVNCVFRSHGNEV